MKTVQVGVKMLIDSEASSDWGVIMAGTVSAVVPTLIVFFVLQSIFVKSLTRSGIKGRLYLDLKKYDINIVSHFSLSPYIAYLLMIIKKSANINKFCLPLRCLSVHF